MNFKYLISSGCSFSDNCFGGRWPHFFANSVNAELYNRGQGSCGNDWISKTAIYEAIGLISAGYDPNRFAMPSRTIIGTTWWSTNCQSGQWSESCAFQMPQRRPKTESTSSLRISASASDITTIASLRFAVGRFGSAPSSFRLQRLSPSVQLWRYTAVGR